ncbi:MAG: YaiI/YqxD family protein [Rhodospirillaceae bacterium]
MPEIYIDADACPVKEEVLRVAERHTLNIHVVGNAWMRRPEGPLVNKVVVPEGPDVADDWIADRIQAHDICITGDIPLASRCLEKGAAVLGHSGKPFTPDSIGMALAMRDLKAQLRETGDIKDHHAGFTKADRSRFLSALEEMVRAVKVASQ